MDNDMQSAPPDVLQQVWVLAAEFEHETKPTRLDSYTHVLFIAEETAIEYLNGELGEQIANFATEDSKCDPELDGYWLGDVIAHQVSWKTIANLYADHGQTPTNKEQ